MHLSIFIQCSLQLIGATKRIKSMGNSSDFTTKQSPAKYRPKKTQTFDDGNVFVHFWGIRKIDLRKRLCAFGQSWLHSPQLPDKTRSWKSSPLWWTKESRQVTRVGESSKSFQRPGLVVFLANLRSPGGYRSTTFWGSWIWVNISKTMPFIFWGHSQASHFAARAWKIKWCVVDWPFWISQIGW